MAEFIFGMILGGVLGYCVAVVVLVAEGGKLKKTDNSPFKWSVLWNEYGCNWCFIEECADKKSAIRTAEKYKKDPNKVYVRIKDPFGNENEED